MSIRKIPVTNLIVDHHTVAVLGLSVLIGIILVLRCFSAVFYPILFNEDGTRVVAFYLNNPHLSAVLQFYAGYVALLPNLIGYLIVTFFPLHIVPYVLVAVSLCFAVIPMMLFSLKRFRFIMPSDTARFMVCLGLVLFPLGNHALVTNLTFSIINIFAIALLLLVGQLPKSKVGGIAQFLFIALAIFSHPFSILLAPVCFALFFMRPARSDRIYNAGIAVLVVIYYFVGVHPGEAAHGLSLSNLWATGQGVAQRVIFEPIFGNSLRMLLHNAGLSLVINLLALFVLALLVAIVSYQWHNTALRNRVPMLGFVTLVVFSLTFISVAGRTSLFGPLTDLVWGQRYFFIQQFLVLFILLSHIIGLTKWQRLSLVTRSALVVSILTYAFFLNVQHASFFQTSREHSQATMKFLREAETRLRQGNPGADGPQEMALRRGGKWDIKIKLKHP